MLEFLDYMYKTYANNERGEENDKDTKSDSQSFNMDELAQKVAERLSGINPAQQSDSELELQEDSVLELQEDSEP